MQPNHVNRRDWMWRAIAAAIGASYSAFPVMSGADDSSGGCTLSIGTYAMPGMSLEQAIRIVADTGFDGIEIAVRADYDGEPSSMSADRRERVRRQLQQSNLKLTALMESMRLAESDATHTRQCERLKAVGELANDLATGATPLVQTTLGGGTWNARRELFQDRLGDWVDILRKAGVVLAIKPHRGHAIWRPEEAVWLIHQLDDTPWLRMVYDYSHYAFGEASLEDTIAIALPFTAHIAVKDVVKQGNRFVFCLPGTSETIDYTHMLQFFYEGGYRADICCEVSAMVSRLPGYDPREAAQICYRNIARALEQAQIPRNREE